MRALTLILAALTISSAYGQSEVTGPYQKALESIQKGDQEGLKRAIQESGLSPNVRVCASRPGKTSCTTLVHQAIRYGQAGALKTLAAMPGLNPNLVELTDKLEGRREESAVILALRMGRTDIAGELMRLSSFDPSQVSTNTEYGPSGVRTFKDDVHTVARRSGQQNWLLRMLKVHNDQVSLEQAGRTALAN